VPPPDRFSASGDDDLARSWWTAFGQPVLNREVEAALRNNFSLAAAWERVQAANAVYRRTAADRWPALDAVAEAVRGDEENGGNSREEYRAGLQAGYEVDLWGRIRSRVEAEEFRARATKEDYETAALSLAAEVSRTWMLLTEAVAQERLLEEQLKVNERALSLLESRFANGQSPAADVLRQEGLTEATRERLSRAKSRRAVLQNLLAVLKGRSPSAAKAPETGPLPDLPPLPATGLPAELLQRRPDLKAAYLRLEASNRDLAEAVRDRFPRLNLTAGLETVAEDPSGLFEDWTDQLAASLIGPILDGGQRAAEVRRRRALEREQLNLYAQTAVEAFREVEDALVREQRRKERLTSLRRQLELARQTYEQLRIEYFNGTGDYLDVLTALTDRQELRRALLQARRELLENRIALYRSLAGSAKTPVGHEPDPS
jgi:NodT family efflux transporter outer membrane factor (OMF) lipoprotein